MARRQPIEIAKTLKHLLPKRRITTLAKEVGATQRERKVGSAAFVLSLILGFGVGNLRTLAILVRPPRDADVLERYLVPFLVAEDRKSTRLNSSHSQISYAVFSLKKNQIKTLNSQLPFSQALARSLHDSRTTK